MRLRVFEAPTVQEALAEMRRVLGADAVILGAREGPEGARVTAALALDEPAPGHLLEEGGDAEVAAVLARVLAAHRLLDGHRRALLEDATASGLADPEAALAHALARLGRFAPPATLLRGRFALVGEPGGGKTTLLARLAAAARLGGHSVCAATLDGGRAGTRARTEALLAPLGLELAEPEALTSATADLVLLDTAGLDPLDGAALARLVERVEGLGLAPVLVLPALHDALDAFEIASNFRALGCERAVVTRLDTARRLGGVVGLLAAGPALAGVTTGPRLAHALRPLTPAALARLLIHLARPETVENAA